MKKLMTIIILILLSTIISQNSVWTSSTGINVSEIFKTYQKNRLIHAMVCAESGGKWHAINHKEGAVGVLQIRGIMTKHINRISGSNYTLSDRLDSVKSVEMFNKLMSLRNPGYDFDIACELWNSGMINPQSPRIKKKVDKYKAIVMKYY